MERVADTELLDPATGELVTAAELHRRGTEGAWVQVVSLDPATGRVVVASGPLRPSSTTG